MRAPIPLRLALCAAAALEPSVGAAQLANTRTGAGIAFERYAFDDAAAIGIESISLLTLPLAASVEPTPGLLLRVSGAYARGEMVRAGGTESSIAGLTDTELRASYAFGGDLVVLTAIALLPTGHATHSPQEVDLAGVIAADVLPFRITNWGAGGGYGANAAVARSFAGFGVGLGVGYVVATEFEPLESQEFAYRPGDQLHVRAALDRTVGPAAKVSLQAGYFHFGEDRLDGSNLFRAGDRFETIGSLAFPAGARSSGIVYAGFARRERGRFLDESRDAPGQNLFMTGAGLRIPLRSLLLQPDIGVRVVSSGGAGAADGYVAAIGTGLEIPLGPALVVPGARFRFGRLELDGGRESGISGFDLSVAARLRSQP